MSVEISAFDPLSSTDADLAELHSVIMAAITLSHPEQTRSTLEQYVQQIREPRSFNGLTSRWVAREDGHIVGHASATYPEHENRHLTLLMVTVAPERRRHGIGTALLRAVVPQLDVDGRPTVVGNGIKADSAGDVWARKWGFVPTQGYERQLLTVSDVDPHLWQRPVPDGFRLERWLGAVPEALLEQYARGRTAIVDAPHGETTVAFQDWTPERVRTYEADLRTQHFHNRVVVAVHEASGRVAALTELGHRAGHSSRVFQLETAVAADFRGRGLGLAVKGAMLRWLTADQPEVAQIFTQTATDNVHMSRINHALGYVTTAVTVVMEVGIAELVKRLET